MRVPRRSLSGASARETDVITNVAPNVLVREAWRPLNPLRRPQCQPPRTSERTAWQRGDGRAPLLPLPLDLEPLQSQSPQLTQSVPLRAPRRYCRHVRWRACRRGAAASSTLRRRRRRRLPLPFLGRSAAQTRVHLMHIPRCDSVSTLRHPKRATSAARPKPAC